MALNNAIEERVRSSFEATKKQPTPQRLGLLKGTLNNKEISTGLRNEIQTFLNTTPHKIQDLKKDLTDKSSKNWVQENVWDGLEYGEHDEFHIGFNDEMNSSGTTQVATNTVSNSSAAQDEGIASQPELNQTKAPERNKTGKLIWEEVPKTLEGEQITEIRKRTKAELGKNGVDYAKTIKFAATLLGIENNNGEIDATFAKALIAKQIELNNKLGASLEVDAIFGKLTNSAMMITTLAENNHAEEYISISLDAKELTPIYNKIKEKKSLKKDDYNILKSIAKKSKPGYINDQILTFIVTGIDMKPNKTESDIKFVAEYSKSVDIRNTEYAKSPEGKGDIDKAKAALNNSNLFDTLMDDSLTGQQKVKAFLKSGASLAAIFFGIVTYMVVGGPGSFKKGLAMIGLGGLGVMIASHYGFSLSNMADKIPDGTDKKEEEDSTGDLSAESDEQKAAVKNEAKKITDSELASPVQKASPENKKANKTFLARFRKKNNPEFPGSDANKIYGGLFESDSFKAQNITTIKNDLNKLKTGTAEERQAIIDKALYKDLKVNGEQITTSQLQVFLTTLLANNSGAETGADLFIPEKGLTEKVSDSASAAMKSINDFFSGIFSNDTINFENLKITPETQQKIADEVKGGLNTAGNEIEAGALALAGLVVLGKDEIAGLIDKGIVSIQNAEFTIDKPEEFYKVFEGINMAEVQKHIDDSQDTLSKSLTQLSNILGDGWEETTTKIQEFITEKEIDKIPEYISKSIDEIDPSKLTTEAKERLEQISEKAGEWSDITTQAIVNFYNNTVTPAAEEVAKMSTDIFKDSTQKLQSYAEKLDATDLKDNILQGINTLNTTGVISDLKAEVISEMSKTTSSTEKALLLSIFAVLAGLENVPNSNKNTRIIGEINTSISTIQTAEMKKDLNSYTKGKNAEEVRKNILADPLRITVKDNKFYWKGETEITNDKDVYIYLEKILSLAYSIKPSVAKAPVVKTAATGAFILTNEAYSNAMEKEEELAKEVARLTEETKSGGTIEQEIVKAKKILSDNTVMGKTESLEEEVKKLEGELTVTKAKLSEAEAALKKAEEETKESKEALKTEKKEIAEEKTATLLLQAQDIEAFIKEKPGKEMRILSDNIKDVTALYKNYKEITKIYKPSELPSLRGVRTCIMSIQRRITNFNSNKQLPNSGADILNPKKWKNKALETQALLKLAQDGSIEKIFPKDDPIQQNIIEKIKLEKKSLETKMKETAESSNIPSIAAQIAIYQEKIKGLRENFKILEINSSGIDILDGKVQDAKNSIPSSGSASGNGAAGAAAAPSSQVTTVNVAPTAPASPSASAESVINSANVQKFLEKAKDMVGYENFKLIFETMHQEDLISSGKSIPEFLQEIKNSKPLHFSSDDQDIIDFLITQ